MYETTYFFKSKKIMISMWGWDSKVDHGQQMLKSHSFRFDLNKKKSLIIKGEIVFFIKLKGQKALKKKK